MEHDVRIDDSGLASYFDEPQPSTGLKVTNNQGDDAMKVYEIE